MEDLDILEFVKKRIELLEKDDQKVDSLESVKVDCEILKNNKRDILYDKTKNKYMYLYTLHNFSKVGEVFVERLDVNMKNFSDDVMGNLDVYEQFDLYSNYSSCIPVEQKILFNLLFQGLQSVLKHSVKNTQ